MDAILSDIEGNLEALEAVLDSVEQYHVERIICLGDLVSYGPNPVECVELLRGSEIYIASDWDLAAAAAIKFERCLEEMQQLAWVQKQFVARPELLDFLRSGKFIHSSGNRTYFHGTPQSRSEYIFPEEIYIPGKLDRILKPAQAVSFCGETHVPGLFTKQPDWNFQAPHELSKDWISLSDFQERCLCNVGSVGQPRDGDRRASYVLDDGERIRFVRVDYDSETTRRKIRDNPDLDDNAGDRLSWGR